MTVLVIGIFVSVGYFLETSSVCSYVRDRIGGKCSKVFKACSFGTTMMSLGIFGHIFRAESRGG